MDSFALPVRGLKELDDALRLLPENVAKRVLRKALGKAAEPVRLEASRLSRRAHGGPTYAARYVPKKKHEGGARGPGHMADSLVATVKLSRRDGATVKVGPDKDHWYMVFQEFGTPHVPADPVLRPALETKAAAAVNILADELGAGIEREAKKLARKATR